MAFKVRGSSDFQLFFSLGDFSNCRVICRSSCKNGLLSIFVTEIDRLLQIEIQKKNELFIPEPQ